ncbi:hypothetical protein ACJXDE_05530 [Enterococcus faecium]|uniref:hypothetical protein n=1 Tax=Enterococcus faecium TaxID=1352 RepID=UPI0038D45FB7
MENIKLLKKSVRISFYIWLFLLIPYLIPVVIIYYFFKKITKIINAKRKIFVPDEIGRLIYWAKSVGWTNEEIIREMNQKVKKYPQSSISIWYKANDKKFSQALRKGFSV